MPTAFRFTSKDLEAMPQIEGVRYEIIDGDLHVSRQATWAHQHACDEAYRVLQDWSDESRAGYARSAPGLVFAEDEDVIPDVVWISNERLAAALDDSGHLRMAPELVVEVLSTGTTNERRDREFKLKLYSRQGVEEYWIVNRRLRTVQVYRRGQQALQLICTALDGDTLTSSLLPGFCCPVRRFWWAGRSATAP